MSDRMPANPEKFQFIIFDKKNKSHAYQYIAIADSTKPIPLY